MTISAHVLHVGFSTCLKGFHSIRWIRTEFTQKSMSIFGVSDFPEKKTESLKKTMCFFCHFPGLILIQQDHCPDVAFPSQAHVVGFIYGIVDVEYGQHRSRLYLPRASKYFQKWGHIVMVEDFYPFLAVQTKGQSTKTPP